MASRTLSHLDPECAPLFHAFLSACKAARHDVLITCVYRSDQEQARLYAQGRTAPGAIITNARPGESLHNRTIAGKPASRAIDIVPIIAGKLIWDDKAPIWHKVGELGEAAGLEWAGRWRRFREFPHFQKA